MAFNFKQYLADEGFTNPKKEIYYRKGIKIHLSDEEILVKNKVYPVPTNEDEAETLINQLIKCGS